MSFLFFLSVQWGKDHILRSLENKWASSLCTWVVVLWVCPDRSCCFVTTWADYSQTLCHMQYCHMSHDFVVWDFRQASARWLFCCTQSWVGDLGWCSWCPIQTRGFTDRSALGPSPQRGLQPFHLVSLPGWLPFVPMVQGAKSESSKRKWKLWVS